MNRLKKLLTLGLSCSLFLGSFTAKAVATNSVSLPTEDSVKEPETILSEVLDKRELNIKTFLTSEYRYQAYVYSSAVHYKVNGKFEEIDNSLVQSRSDVALVENTANAFSVKFAKNTNSNKIVSFSSGSLGLSWGFEGLSKSFITIDNSDSKKITDLTNISKTQSMALYTDAFLNTDIQYILDGDQLKENFILKSKGAPTSFTQTITIQQGSISEEEGKIVFKDKEGVTQFIMGNLSMSDASGEFSDRVTYSYVKTTQGIDLTITADQTWINDPVRVYPITIDPSVESSVKRADLEDCHVSSNFPNSNFYQSYILKSGWKSNSLNNQTYLRFTLPKLTSADLVVNTTLRMFVKLDGSDPTEMQVNVYEVTGDWTENTLTWNNKPTNQSTIEDYEMVTSNEFVYWDITRLTRQWYLTEDNHGVVIKNQNTGGVYKEYYSAETDIAYEAKRPLIIVTYINNNGLEDLWTYTTQDLGRAGTAFVNNGSGNLVIMREDLFIPGGKMPVSVTAFFSNENRNSETMGWKTNYEQTITLELLNEVEYYTYVDADGTKVYFVYDPTTQKWTDELGKGLELTVVPIVNIDEAPEVCFIITDKSDNTLEFDRDGYLIKLKDNAETPNFVKIEYTTESPKRINTITDSSGRRYKFVYSIIGNDVIIEIDYCDADNTILKFVKYEFNDSENIVTVSYSDNNSVSYNYDPVYGYITEVLDIDGFSNKFTYTDKDPKVVLSMTEYGELLDNQSEVPEYLVGSKYIFSYSQYETTITDRNENVVTYQFDSMGRTICIKDANNAAQYYEYGVLGGAKNKLTSVSKLQTTTINLAKNISFETTSNWAQFDSLATLNSPIYSTTLPLFGAKSLSITHTGTASRIIYAYENIPVSISNLEKASYTLSAYVKSSVIGAAHLSISVNGEAQPSSIDNKVDTANEWQRISSTINISGKAVSSIQIRLVVDANAAVQFDGVQLEKGVGVNRYNLVENPSLEYTTSTVPTGWNANGTSSSIDFLDINNPIFDTKSYKITGSATSSKSLSQTIAISGNQGDVFSFGGWAKAISAAKLSGRSFGLSMKFNYTNSTTETKIVSFNSSAYTWQYAQAKAIASNDYTSVVLSFDYINQVNEVYFDGAQLYREEFGKTYSYDSMGNLITSKDLSGNSSLTSYDTTNQLLSQMNPDGSYVAYDYDNFHKVIAAQSSTGVSTKIAYDSFGNPISTTISNAVFGNKLIAYYKFDDNLLDSSGNGYDGTNQNGTFEKGLVGEAIHFDGLSQFAELDPFSVPDIFSVTMWVKNERSPLSTNECIIGKNTTTGGNQLLIGEYNSKLGVNINSNATTDFGTKTSGYQFIVVTFEKVNDTQTHVMMYKDTVLIGDYTTTNLVGDTSSGKVWAVGMEWDSTVKSDFFKGSVDELAFYEGALDVNEINNIYGLINTKQQVALYDFAGTNHLLDKSGNGHVATTIGTVAFTNDKLVLTGSGYMQLDDFSIGQDLTVVMTIKPNSVGNFSLFAKHDAYGNNILIEGYYAGIHTRIRDNTVVGSTLVTGVTKTIVYTIKQVNETQSRVQIYVDGVAQFTAGTLITGVMGDTKGKPWIIGQEWDGSSPSDYFNGTIDNLAIYNFEMSSTEVTENSTALATGTYDPATPVYPITGDQSKTINSTATYSNSGNYITSVTDSRGNTAIYKYDETYGRLNSFRTPDETEDEATKYTYDNNTNLVTEVKKIVDLKTYANTYTYDLDRLVKITHNGFDYEFSYDSFEYPYQIKIAGTTLIANTYNSDSGLLDLLTYGNSDTISYTYDDVQRVIRKENNDGNIFEYTYNNEGNLSSITNLRESYIQNILTRTILETTHYYYDFLSRPVKAVNSNGQVFLFNYDTLGRVSALTNTLGTISYKNEYVYGDQYIPGQIPGQIYNVKLNGTTQLSYAFDQLARLSTRTLATTTPFTTTYTYLDGSGANSTTTLLASMTNGTNAAFNYTYDSDGNILTISEGSTLKASYTYDKMNQLISEDNAYSSKSIDYVYDIGGNITSRTEYNYTNGSRGTLIDTYTYGYSITWKDQMTSYDEQTITYDSIGNPLTYRNGISFSWTNGRELASYSKSGITTNYTYNDSGIRTSKKIGNNAETTYYLNGSSIVRQVTGDKILDFFYDENGNLYGFKDDGAMYYYVRNGQSDIIGILDSTGLLIASYVYDSWGNLVNKNDIILGTVAYDNPFRYRGYYFDSDTELYYLNSRYYDSSVGRFINADYYVSNGIGFFGFNMYTYCVNNSVNMLDDSGSIPEYINSQKELTRVYLYGEKVKLMDLKWGLVGNLVANGCGIIAAYNVMFSQEEGVEFGLVRDEMWLMGGPVLFGLLGVDPRVLTNFMFLHFKNVRIGGPFTLLWDYIAKVSKAVIILGLANDLSSAHYFAGIKQANGNYIFYNSGVYDGKEISFTNMMKRIREIFIPWKIIGVGEKRGWW